MLTVYPPCRPYNPNGFGGGKINAVSRQIKLANGGILRTEGRRRLDIPNLYKVSTALVRLLYIC